MIIRAIAELVIAVNAQFPPLVHVVANGDGTYVYSDQVCVSQGPHVAVSSKWSCPAFALPLVYVLDRKRTAFDWKSLFGSGHKHAELMMIMLKRDKEANIEKFLVHLDSRCYLLLSALYPRLKPGKTYPSYGGAINDANIATALPNAISALKALHALRLESSVAHPRSQKTSNPTRQLKHSDFYKIRK